MKAAEKLEVVRLTLSRIVGRRVMVIERTEWREALHHDGSPTRLAAPLTPFRGAEQGSQFLFAVASGAPYTNDAGIHRVRYDLADGDTPFNTDSEVVIENLRADSRWSDVLTRAGLTDDDELRALVDAHVFAFRGQRDDHHSSTVPHDIEAAEPVDPIS
jgi:hypothetical protein